MKIIIEPHEKELFKKAIIKFGFDDQLLKLCEESSEIITAVSHYKRGRADLYKIIEESADTLIMVMQIISMLEGNDQVFQEQLNFKLERLAKRLEST